VWNGIEMVCEMASDDSDWPVSSPPPSPPIWKGIRTTKVVPLEESHDTFNFTES
jgi:hypothetical protein